MPDDALLPAIAPTELIEQLDQVAEQYSDIAEVVPYARAVIRGWAWVQHRRIRRFIRTLGQAATELDPEKRARLRKILESERGQEIVTELADSALRTSSRVAVCALALLAADAASEEYPEHFRLSASFSLQGLTDELVHLFLDLPELAEQARRRAEDQRREEAERAGNSFKPDPSDPKPYPVYFLNEFLESSLSARGGLTVTVAGQVGSISELIRRGLLLPDHAVGRFGGVSCPFGIGEDTQRYLRLLDLATRYVEEGAA